MAIKYEIVWAKQVSTAVSYTYICIQTGLHFVCVQMMSEYEVHTYVYVYLYVQYVCMYSMYIRTYIHTPILYIRMYVRGFSPALSNQIALECVSTSMCQEQCGDLIISPTPLCTTVQTVESLSYTVTQYVYTYVLYIH